MTIKDFVDKNPSFSEILDFVEREAARIVSERKATKKTEVDCPLNNGVEGQEVKT